MNRGETQGVLSDATVAGVDGCRGGWLVVAVCLGGGARRAELVVAWDFGAVLALTERAHAVAVDIPIGLSESGSRECDILARRMLGKRGSAVFPAPVRRVLPASTYEEANELSRRYCGRGLSKQAYAILPKIRDADQCLTRDLQARIWEVHPEVCFLALNGFRPVMSSKKDSQGEAERERLLAGLYTDLDRALGERPKGVKPDDVLDAFVAAYTAECWLLGRARSLPETPSTDGKGLRIEMVYPDRPTGQAR